MMAKPKKTVKKQMTIQKFWAIVQKPFIATVKRMQRYTARRPHRSFRLTRKRDYKRSLKLPGYFAFTAHVRKTLWSNRKLFIWVIIFYAALTAVLVGMSSQDTYSTFSDTLKQTGGDIFSGNWGEISKAGLLFVTILTGGASDTLSEVQQVYAGLIFILTWLSTVWLLRSVLAGHKVKFRDGLYNSASSIVSTFLVALVLIVQLLPLAIALIGYSAALGTGLLDGGVEAMLFWISAGLLAILSVYWASGTFIALVVITLPGMYPMNALKTAGDLVVGRRVRIILRMLWLGLGVAVIWSVTMIPIILFDSWIKGLWPAVSWLPIVPLALLAMSSFTVVWTSSYIYLLYRKVIADDSAPA